MNDEEETSTLRSRSRGLAASDSMITIVLEKTLRPIIRSIQNCLNSADEMQLLSELYKLNNFLLTFSETFAELVPSLSDHDYFNLGPILSKLLENNYEVAEIHILTCRCVGILAGHSKVAAKQMIEAGILKTLRNFLDNFEYIDTAEAAFDALIKFTHVAPRECLLANIPKALLFKLDFFPRSSQLSALEVLCLIFESFRPLEDSIELLKEPISILLSSLQENLNDLQKITPILKCLAILTSSPTIEIKSMMVEYLPRIEKILETEASSSIWSKCFQIYLNLSDDVGKVLPFFNLYLNGISKLNTSFSGRTERDLIQILLGLVSMILSSSDENIKILPIDYESSNGKLLLSHDSVVQLKTQALPLSSDSSLSLLKGLVKILYSLPITQDTIILSLLLIYASIAAVNCGNTEIVKAIIDDMIMIMLGRNSLSSLLSLTILTIYNAKHHISSLLAVIEPQDWVLPSHIESYLPKISGIGKFYSNLKYENINELARLLESRFHVEPQVKSAIEDLIEDSDETVEIIEKIHRLIMFEDYKFPLLVLDSGMDKKVNNPLDWMYKVSKPVNVQIRVTSNPRIIEEKLSVDPFVTPFQMYRKLTAGESFQDEKIDFIDKDVRIPFRKVSDEENMLCQARLLTGSSSTLFAFNPSKPLFAVALAGREITDMKDLQQALQSFINVPIEIVFKTSREQLAMEVQPYSPMFSNQFQKCIDALAEIAYLNSESSEYMRRLINLHLDSKFARQFQQIPLMISGIIPESYHTCIRLAPFLFSLETKKDYVVATEFPFTRYVDSLISKFKNEVSENASRRFGIIPKVLCKVDRSSDDVVNEIEKAFTHFAANKDRVIEFEFLDEVGIGSGPTREVYTLFSRDLQRQYRGLWLTSDPSMDFVSLKTGLYPSPKASGNDFILIGMLVARSLLDSKSLDLPLNRVFVDLILSKPVPLSLKTLAKVDPDLAQSVKKLSSSTKEELEGIYFVHPAYPDLELCPGGNEKHLTPTVIDYFIECLLRFILETSIKECVHKFQEGFCQILPLKSFEIFTPIEFLQILNGDPVSEPWSQSSLLGAINADHGYLNNSCQIIWLTEVISELEIDERKKLLQFLTGSSNLPIGGWDQLTPALTVVCRTSDNPDDSLPSVMTCANYLKLPRYSSKQKLKEKLLFAIEEGQGSFSLS